MTLNAYRGDPFDWYRDREDEEEDDLSPPDPSIANQYRRELQTDAPPQAQKTRGQSPPGPPRVRRRGPAETDEPSAPERVSGELQIEEVRPQKADPNEAAQPPRVQRSNPATAQEVVFGVEEDTTSPEKTRIAHLEERVEALEEDLHRREEEEESFLVGDAEARKGV